MYMTWFATLVAGLLSMIGLGGIFTGVVLRAERLRSRAFRIGTVALTFSGLVLMLGSLIGWLGTNEMFGGLLLLMFGTGARLMPLKPAHAPAPERSES
jgi:hypothetical protein